MPECNPGVGLYNPVNSQTFKKLPSVRLGRAQRFEDANKLVKYKETMYELFCNIYYRPVSYLNIQLKYGKIGVNI
jgi:hypothetical protein